MNEESLHDVLEKADFLFQDICEKGRSDSADFDTFAFRLWHNLTVALILRGWKVNDLIGAVNKSKKQAIAIRTERSVSNNNRTKH